MPALLLRASRKPFAAAGYQSSSSLQHLHLILIAIRELLVVVVNANRSRGCATILLVFIRAVHTNSAMSRWTSKNRASAQAYAFPLDSLAKETKENTNRPVAARSAGTVGKWGTTSFTSIRTPAYGKYQSFVHDIISIAVS